jgi:peptide/nickel transport system substrate-binding protein
MNEQELRRLIAEVKAGKLSRRQFIQTVAAVGLTAPMATQLLSWGGVVHA